MSQAGEKGVKGVRDTLRFLSIIAGNKINVENI